MAGSPNPTDLLLAWGRGEASALDTLMPLVYQELKQLARRHMSHERPGQTIQTTILVNEAYLRLIEVKRIQWQDRAHFFAMSSRVMRRILVEAAARRAIRNVAGMLIEQLSMKRCPSRVKETRTSWRSTMRFRRSRPWTRARPK